MPSFLINDKMNPALRARVQKSLGMRSHNARMSPTGLSLLRAGALLGIVGAVAFFGYQFEQSNRELEQEKARVLAALRKESAGLSESDRTLVKRATPWLQQGSLEYEGDKIAPAAATPQALAETLQRPSVYVRADFNGFRNTSAINASAAASDRDALLFCLLAPPDAVTEKALLDTIATTWGGGDSSAKHSERLYSAIAGLPMLAPEWELRVEMAKHVQKARQLGELVAKAPLAQARAAAQAELLIFAVDEPKEPDAPSEFDGAARHHVRVYVVDLVADKLLLRVRRAVDPAWVSERQRHRNAQRLTDCRLAYEVIHGTGGDSEVQPPADKDARRGAPSGAATSRGKATKPPREGP